MNCRMPLNRMAWGLGMVVLITACATQFQQQEQALQQPIQINCATAEGDIRGFCRKVRFLG
jgi:hypothetical protein